MAWENLNSNMRFHLIVCQSYNGAGSNKFSLGGEFRALREYSHALRLVCEHSDLRAANANSNNTAAGRRIAEQFLPVGESELKPALSFSSMPKLQWRRF